jgi:hypothetical protein
MCLLLVFLRHQSDSGSWYGRLLFDAVMGVSPNVVFVQHVIKLKLDSGEIVACFSCWNYLSVLFVVLIDVLVVGFF